MFPDRSTTVAVQVAQLLPNQVQVKRGNDLDFFVVRYGGLA